jgi:hypothetical protein
MTGACLCGAVAYQVDGEVSGVWFCHCSKCRRANGSAFQAAAVCARESFRWTGGEALIAGYSTPSGYRRSFCRTCGSPVPLFVAGTDYVWLPAGALECDAVGLRASRHIFVGSKAPWFEITDALPRFEAHAPRGDAR